MSERATVSVLQSVLWMPPQDIPPSFGDNYECPGGSTKSLEFVGYARECASISFLFLPQKIDFVSSSNSNSPRNSLHKKLSLASVRDFLRKIEPNYIFASILDAIDLEFGFSRVDFPPKGSKSKQIVVILAKT